MKFSILSALLAFSVATASAESFSGRVYVYQNDGAHPKTTFVKKLPTGVVVSEGIACNGDQTLPGVDGAACNCNQALPGTYGPLTATFTTIDNQWGYNNGHDSDILMGYINIDGNQCFSLIRGYPLRVSTCPPYDTPIKTGNRFAWYHDKRSGAIWAYGGDAKGAEASGIVFATKNLHTDGQILTGLPMPKDSAENGFIGIGRVNFGDSAQSPTGCA